MNTLQLKRALERNPLTKKTFCGVFAADELPIINTFPCGFVAKQILVQNREHTGWLFTFPLVKKENSLIVTDIHLNIMVNHLNSTKSKHGTIVSYRVRGAKCVDSIVFFTFIIEAAVIA